MRNKQVIGIFAFILISISFIHSAENTAMLDSLSGTAEVQRAGSSKWKPFEVKGKLYNNDVLRINKGGHGRVSWPDKSEAYIHGGSQILINIGPSESKNKLLSYATVFMGSAFFVIQKVLPKSKKESIQIYTPTAVISIRGTSLSIEVAPESGTSTIKVVSGTVRVSCIKNNSSAFLSAPFKTAVEKITAPIKSVAMLTADFDTLKTWVPPNVIDHQMAQHLAETKHNQTVISGRLDAKCIIMPFVNNSTYDGPWDVSNVLPKILMARLKKEHHRIKISVADSMTTDAAAVSEATGSRFVISAAINMLDIINTAAITVRADEYHERSIAKVKITFTIYDNEGKVETVPIEVSGERTGRKNVKNSWKTIDKYPLDCDNAEFRGSIVGAALEQAMEQAVEKLTNLLYE